MRAGERGGIAFRPHLERIGLLVDLIAVPDEGQGEAQIGPQPIVLGKELDLVGIELEIELGLGGAFRRAEGGVIQPEVDIPAAEHRECARFRRGQRSAHHPPRGPRAWTGADGPKRP